MAVTESDPIFLNFVNVEGEVKNKLYILEKFEGCIKKSWGSKYHSNHNDNAFTCKFAGAIVEIKFSQIFRTSCIVHTLNLALKNIHAAKNMEANVIPYAQYSWITKVPNDVLIINSFFYHEPFHEACHVQ